MTVFKAFLKIVNKYKFTIIMYTVILVAFGGFNMQTSEQQTSFVASKPDVLIINQDEEIGITKNLVEYIKQNSNIKDIQNTEEAINDALFYRDINYIIYIPENYRQDFLKGENPKIQIKKTDMAEATFAEMMLERYLKIANTYKGTVESEDELITKINETISKQAEIEITSKLDTDNLAKATFYYNFASYSILAGAVYLICLVISSFREEKIRKRTIISSTNYKKHNRQLLVSNGIFAVILWLLYVVLSFILIGNIMFTIHGLIFILNSFVFSICALTVAFLIGNLVNNKNAINGIVNVVALGSSFLCGAFVPMEWLPDAVLKVAHFLPTYWYIQNNEMVKTLEVIDWKTLEPVVVNMGVILLFAVGFVVVTNVVAKMKRKIA